MTTRTLEGANGRGNDSVIGINVPNRRRAQFIARLICPLPIDHQAVITIADSGLGVHVGALEASKDLYLGKIEWNGDDCTFHQDEHLFADALPDDRSRTGVGLGPS